MIYADHVNMVKLSDPADDGCVKILHAIKVLLKEKLRSTGQSKSTYSIYLTIAYRE